MQYLIIILFIAILSIAIGGCKKHSTPSDEKYILQTETFSRNEIARRLLAMSNEPAPTNLKSVCAMCYMMSGSSAETLPTDFICKTCGGKTVYAGSSDHDLEAFIEYTLPNMKRSFREIKSTDSHRIELDDTQFCMHCNPTLKKRELVLRVCYDGEKPHESIGISRRDIRLVVAFVNGQDRVAANWEGDELPLKMYTRRLSELLGVTEVFDGMQLQSDE